VGDARIYESVPNFSEGRRAGVIAELSRAAARAHLLDTDPDPDHNRVVISIAGVKDRLVDALIATAGEAVQRIDVTRHAGVHPRVGAADVVPIVPLGGSTLEQCRELAREIGQRFWSELRVPVYFYGEGEGRSLADIRNGRAKPDLGGPSPHPTAGAVCVGARPALVAFNVLLPGSDLTTARAVARTIRESGAGMRGVQALVFELPGGRLQLSMNLFRIDESSPSAVIAELGRLGVSVGAEQLVGLCPAGVANGAATGRILEGRLASAAAVAAAARCEEAGDEERAALAARLRGEASALAGLGIEQDAVLAGAERSAALIPVLRAGGVLDDELESLLAVAARGLRAAVTAGTQALYGARIAALDARLRSGRGGG
jgi:glutamate formiminotransferase